LEYRFYRPGQEAGNIPFVEDNGFGRYSADPKEIAETVSSWLASPEKLHKMQDAALAAARPHATIDIAKDLAGILFEAKRAKQVKTQTAVAAA
jgi:1,2-diacylglycerol 3-beta-galactosyltransferase